MTIVALGQVAGLAVALAAAGACTGFLAGVFGVGGGTIIVPVLYEVFGLYGVNEEVRMPLCVGTSLAVIIPTSIASFRGHYSKGSVDLAVLRAWAIPIVAGVGVGIVAAAFAKPFLFKVVFIIVSLLLAIRFLAGKNSWRRGERLPTGGAMTGCGLAIGASSALMGIGGGLVANIVLSLFGKPIHAAVATASGVGVLVSIPGAIGYVIAGWHRSDLPPLSLGFVSVIGCALLIPLSLATVRHGVGLAHRLERRPLEIALAAYLVLVSLRFVVTL